MFIQFFGRRLELGLLSDDVRGIVENSESKCSEFWKYPCGWGLKFGLGDALIDKYDDAGIVLNRLLEGGGTAEIVFELLSCKSSAELPVPADSLLSLSVSLRRKSTHRSANDWRKREKYLITLNSEI